MRTQLASRNCTSPEASQEYTSDPRGDGAGGLTLALALDTGTAVNASCLGAGGSTTRGAGFWECESGAGFDGLNVPLQGRSYTCLAPRPSAGLPPGLMERALQARWKRVRCAGVRRLSKWMWLCFGCGGAVQRCGEDDQALTLFSWFALNTKGIQHLIASNCKTRVRMEIDS